MWKTLEFFLEFIFGILENFFCKNLKVVKFWGQATFY